jgi:predicted PurR-regulated permease PerM
MVMIGALSMLAVWLIGLPSPLALGLIAGIAEFIPYVGPIISAIPAILVAATQSLDAVIWTVVAYTLIHQAEGHLVMPFIQRHMVFIPPAVILLGIVAIGALFGAQAIPLASPLAVLIFVLIKKLYVRDTLGEDSPIPGEKS